MNLFNSFCSAIFDTARHIAVRISKFSVHNGSDYG
jgi:hypothetical protein